jgi:hypothetical protein
VFCNGAAVTRAQKNPMVGAAAMRTSKDIVDNAVNLRTTPRW